MHFLFLSNNYFILIIIRLNETLNIMHNAYFYENHSHISYLDNGRLL